MQLGLMHESKCPLTGFFKAAADTLPAGYGDGKIDICLGLIPRKRPFPVLRYEPGPVRTERVIAGHGSQADPATHRGPLHVLDVSFGRSFREKTLGAGFRHFVTAHDVLL